MAMGIKKLNFNFFALGALGRGLSGSDRIFMEFARRWSREFHINIYLWTEGYEMCQRQNLKNKNISFKVSLMKPWKDMGFIINYIARILEGVRLGLTLKLTNNSDTFLYSASEFWMDSFPALILKLRYPKLVTWVAAWYQTAPNPLIGFAEGQRQERYRWKALLYWLVQLPIKPLISRFADFILINNENEKRHFRGFEKKLVVVLGAVDIELISKYIKKFSKLPKIYGAVFQGRFHPQKGVIELIKIWKLVVDKIPKAKLVMMGAGPLMNKVKEEIKHLNLEKNIELKGFMFDGDEKFIIFAQSKIVVHPALFDSGGMASAEAMAFGLPCVGFNLKSYLSYYPKGMVKIKIGDLNAFANAVLRLLANQEYRENVGEEAFEMINRNWSWDQRAKEIFEYVKN